MDRKLRVIPEPKPNTRTIIIPKVLPAIKGNGNLNLHCGNCNALLVEGIHENQIRNMVFKCPICNFHSEIL